jgi:hypothetical protein
VHILNIVALLSPILIIFQLINALKWVKPQKNIKEVNAYNTASSVVGSRSKFLCPFVTSQHITYRFTIYETYRYSVMCIPIARQRVGKHIPATHAHATIGRLLLGNGAVNTHFNNRRRCFPWGPPRGYITRISHTRIRIGSSSGDGSPKWLRRNSKKGIRRCKEDFTCDLKWKWACDKSVARIRPVKTEDHNACATVNWKVRTRRSVIAL